jgi:hypothetical protein
MRLASGFFAVVFALLPLAAACVDDDFADAQFLCHVGGGEDECPSGMVCNPDGRCRSPSAADGCIPRTCDQALPSCGSLDDGCGKTIQCGCWPPLSCGGAGIAGKCGCLPQQVIERSASAFWNDQSITGAAWSNPSNARKSDDGVASATLGVDEHSNYLKAAEFGFDLPSTAVVQGIELVVERSASAAAVVSDHEVRIAIDGVLQPKIDKKPEPWGTADSSETYGSSTELWEASGITPALINESNFGMALAVVSTGAGVSANVDSIRFRVHFANPTCPDGGTR